VASLNERADRRQVRRALAVAEAQDLIRATEAARPHHSLTGRERALVYRLALETGLRYGEIDKLRRLDFHLFAAPPSVCIPAEHEKAGRGDDLPLRSALAKHLAAYSEENLAVPAARAFPKLHSAKGAEMVREDLKAAREAWLEANPGQDIGDRLAETDASGKIVDFHSPHHTFGAMLVAAGAHMKDYQDLMRHSDINLTAGLYTHSLLSDRSRAVAGVSDFSASVAAKIGTDDGPGTELHAQGPQQANRPATRNDFDPVPASMNGIDTSHVAGKQGEKSVLQQVHS